MLQGCSIADLQMNNMTLGSGSFLDRDHVGPVRCGKNSPSAADPVQCLSFGRPSRDRPRTAEPFYALQTIARRYRAVLENLLPPPSQKRRALQQGPLGDSDPHLHSVGGENTLHLRSSDCERRRLHLQRILEE